MNRVKVSVLYSHIQLDGIAFSSLHQIIGDKQILRMKKENNNCGRGREGGGQCTFVSMD